MLELILGRSRSGKTTRIIDEIKSSVENKKRTYLIVPEQQVFISEGMLADLDPSAWRYLKVISFTDLCDLVFSEYGGVTVKRVSEGVKHLFMWHSANLSGSMLTKFGKVKLDPAFADMALLTINEFSAMGVTPEMLEERIKDSDNEDFKEKMQDICLIYSCYMSLMSERLGDDMLLPDAILSMLDKTLEDHDFFTGCDVYIDSFSDFTGIEFSILKKIIAGADRTSVSLAIASRGCDDMHSASARDTLKKLTRFAKDNYIEVRDHICTEGEAYIRSDLYLIERDLWNFRLAKGESGMPDDRDSIYMAECANKYEEAEYIALKILKFRELGYKYSDMAVIPRDAESNKGIFCAVFDKYTIPYFYSEKTDLSITSAARFLLSSLKIISHGYRLDDVLTLVKTGLCPVESSMCDMFEDYCVTWDINGSKFTESTWSMNPDGYTVTVSKRASEILRAANAVKDAIIPCLTRLQSKIRISQGNVKDTCRAIYDYLEEMQLSSTLSSLCCLELSLGNIREAGEVIRMYDYIKDVLTQLAVIFEKDSMSIDDIYSAIEILLKNTDIGSVPAFNDYVTVGSASTLRVENAKIVFMPGLVEGEFPAAVSERGIIKESDKAILSSLGIDMPSGEEKLAADELLFAHRVISKPSDKLILTTYSSDMGGHSRSPSIVWRRVLFILPYLKDKVEKFDLERIKILSRLSASADTQSEISDVYDAGCAPLQNEDGSILDTFGNDDACDGDTPSDQEKGDDIPPMLAQKLLGDTIYLSKSAISTFMLCPYRYWCENILSLRQSKISAMNSADVGTYVHYVLEKLIGEERQSDGSLPHRTHKELLDLANEVSERFINEIGFVPSPSMLYEISRYRDIAHTMLCSIFDEFESSSFKIAALEQSLDSRYASSLKPMDLKIELDGGGYRSIILTGKIDRIDTYSSENGVYVRIVDYKTGTNKFDIDKVSEGNELQLPIYLFSAASEKNRDAAIFGANGKEIFPVSAMFLSSKEESGKISPIRSGFILDDSEILHAASATLDNDILGVKTDKSTGEKSKNCLSDTEMDEMKATLIKTVSDVGKSIYSGYAPKRPSADACKYCKLKNTCHVAQKAVEY